MFKKLLTVISLAIATLFATMGIASAQDYVPPSVTVDATSHSVATSPAIEVLGTSKGVAGGALSYTGTGFDIGGAVTIGAIVLLLGIGLCIAGAKFARGRSAHR